MPLRPSTRKIYSSSGSILSGGNGPLMPRRRFLRHLGGSLLAAPFITSGLWAASPNGKLRHASFGAAGMAWNDINSLMNHGNIELVAVADVDRRNFPRIKERFPDARCFQDWRELLATLGDELDSVNVSTPDHMHGAQGLACMAKGLHIYDQKPLAQNIAECRALTLKARETGVVNQMGIQLSSGFSERFLAALVADGVIGEVREVHTFSDKKWGDMDPRPDRIDVVPEELDWDGWLGVASDRSYISDYYHPGNWRRRRDFGTGTLGDMGCHIFSGWIRALELSPPLHVRADCRKPDPYSWGKNLRVEYLFAGTRLTGGQPIEVIWYDGDRRPPAGIAEQIGGTLPSQGSVLIGTEGAILAPHGSTPRLFPAGKFADYRFPRLEPRDHYGDFVAACRQKGDVKLAADFDYAGPLTEMVLLGCIASAFPGELLEWDQAAMKINHPGANQLIHRPYREGWEVSFR